jgi:ribose 5-phosphate isomerase A
LARALDEAALVAQKRDAAERAAALVASGMAVGLGSGSTAALAVEALARRVAEGSLVDVVAVPTSRATADLARARGLTLTDLERQPVLDLAIDGADEVDPDGGLLKGAGGALVREKIVARAARRFVVIVDETKTVDRLGRRHPLPVAVDAFGWSTHLKAVRDMGADPVLRRHASGRPYDTDDGHFILDCRFPDGIADPEAVARDLKSRTGVIDTGLFLGFRPEVIVGR